MSQLAYQSQVLANFTKKSDGNGLTYRIGQERIATIDKDRYGQLENQWELMNLHDESSLSRQEIQRYFRNKGAFVNESVLANLLNRMKWHGNRVYKQEFCSQALEYERELSSGSNYEKYRQQIAQIGQQVKSKFSNSNFVWLDISRIEVTKDIGAYYSQFMLRIESYMKNDEILRYEVAKYDPEDGLPRFMLPKLNNQRLNISVYLLSVDGDMLGSAFINTSGVDRKQLESALTKDGKDIGSLKWVVDAREQLQEYPQSTNTELEYLRYLFGCDRVTNPKVPINQVKLVIFIRYFITVSLLVGTVLNHLGSRYDSVSLILAIYLLRLAMFVWQKPEVINIFGLALLGLLADTAWIALSVQSIQKHSPLSIYSTYGTMIAKGTLLLYLTARETSPF